METVIYRTVYGCISNSANFCISCMVSAGGRAGQGRAGQGRAGQGRAGQGRAGQGSHYNLAVSLFRNGEPTELINQMAP